MAGVHFLHIAVELTETLLTGDEVFLRTGHDYRHYNESNQRNGDRCKRHSPLRHKHHNQAAYELGNCTDHRRKAVGKCLLKRADIICHTAQNIAVRDFPKALHRDLIDFIGKIPPHFLGQIQRNGSHDILLNISAHFTDQIDRQQDASHLCNGRKVNAGHQSV